MMLVSGLTTRYADFVGGCQPMRNLRFRECTDAS